MTLGVVCEHGRRARSCIVCELWAMVERLPRERDEARTEAERWRGRARLSDPYMYDGDEWALPWKETNR